MTARIHCDTCDQQARDEGLFGWWKLEPCTRFSFLGDQNPLPAEAGRVFHFCSYACLAKKAARAAAFATERQQAADARRRVPGPVEPPEVPGPPPRG